MQKQGNNITLGKTKLFDKLGEILFNKKRFSFLMYSRYLKHNPSIKNILEQVKKVRICKNNLKVKKHDNKHAKLHKQDMWPFPKV